MGLSCAGLVSVLAGLAGKVVVFQAVVVKTFVREMGWKNGFFCGGSECSLKIGSSLSKIPNDHFAFLTPPPS